MRIPALRKTLLVGACVFGVSAIFLISLPGMFLELLGMETGEQLQWSMRMIGITVFALAGNMWNNSKQENDKRVIHVAQIMCVSAMLLGLLTLLVPVEITWFGYLYAIIGFSFAATYLINLVSASQS